MSSLHPDRLPTEGAAPTKGTRKTLPATPGTTSRRAAGTAKVTAPVKASHTDSTQRTGKLSSESATNAPAPSVAGRAKAVRTATAKAARSATVKAARTATSTAKTVTSKAATKAADAKAATTARRAAVQTAAAQPAVSKPVSAKPVAAKTAAPKPAAAPKAAAPKAAAPKAAAPKAAAPKPAAAKAAAPKVAPAKAATAKPTTAKPAAVTTTAAGTGAGRTAAAGEDAVAEDASTTRSASRPTPYRRPVTDEAPAATPEDAVLAEAAAIVDAETPASDVRDETGVVRAGRHAAPRRMRIWHRRPPSAGRRPALYMAAALVGALGVGTASLAGPSALAETTTVSSSVSVAEQLGITEDSAAVVDAQATDRLGELVASRAERDADQAAAAKEQREADKAAAEEARRAAAAAAEAARPKAVLPVKGARLTSGYGARWGTLHAGIDLAAPMHTPEYAVMDGVVLEAGPASGFGLAVYIQHDNGDVTVYGHMDKILVSAGQVVKAGETIALLGNRGQSTGPHLHFEVHKGGLDGTKVDPIPWLRERGIDI